MQKNPHLLIEGMIIAAYASAHNRSFIFIRGEYELRRPTSSTPRVGEARAAGYLGENILGSDHTLDLVVHRGAGAYICGEETALLDSLEGKRGNPRLKPPFPAVQGLYQGPTLINNVETLMNVPIILRMGGEEYAKIGTETSTGTKVVSISGSVERPGNYEIELGTRRASIIYDLAGGPLEGRTFKAWFPGGSSAPVLPGTDEYLDLALRLRLAGQGRLDARLGRDHRLRRLDLDRRRRATRRRSSTATSPAASARRAARARTGPRRCSSGSRTARRPRWTSTSWPRSASRSSATACACSATRWRCRSAR